ncbi:MAG: HEAT repeat domain-containing protein, partial [Planctomycetota bacterium]
LAAELARQEARLDAIRSPELRAAELRSVVRLHGAPAAGLVAGYLADPDPLVRITAARALARIGGASAREPVRSALARERDRRVAEALVQAAGALVDPEAVVLLERRVRDRALLESAVRALVRIGTRDALGVLKRVLAAADEATAARIRRWMQGREPR